MGNFKKSYGMTLLFQLICFAVLLIITLSSQNTVYWIFVLVMLPAIGITVFRFVKEIQNKNAAACAAKDKEMRRAFYKKCKDYKITSISSAADLEKATMIAESLNCPPEAMKDLKAYFEAAEKDLRDDAEATRQSALNEEMQKEKALHAEWTKFANHTGKEKRIAMLQAEYLECERKIEYYNQMAKTGASLGQQKEIDWATRGGIASGLAGGAAGLAAAMDAQAQNAQIRASNAAAREATAPMVFEMMKSAGTYRRIAEGVLENIENSKTKMVSKTPKETVMNHLRFSTPEIKVSDTGAIFVKVEAEVINPVMILGTKQGVVDGTVLAEIYDGQRLAGQCELVLPTWGIKDKKQKLEGICLSGGKKGASYQVKFKPYQLWEMEA